MGFVRGFVSILILWPYWGSALTCADLLNARGLNGENINYVELYSEARTFSLDSHQGQTYVFDIPFRDHLASVEQVLKEFGFNRFTEFGAKLFILARLHDVVEDVPSVSHIEIEVRFGPEIARLVRAVSSDQSLPRLEGFRAIFPLLRANPQALIVKLADRLTNVRNGILMHLQFGDNRYMKNAVLEFPIFQKELYVAGSEAEPLWVELDRVITEYQRDFAHYPVTVRN